MASVGSDIEFNKFKLRVYSEIKKTKPKFKYSQMSKIKFGFQLVEFMEKYNINNINNEVLNIKYNMPVKEMNRKGMKELNRDITEINCGATVDELVRFVSQ